MKNIITIAAIALTFFASCKDNHSHKEEETEHHESEELSNSVSLSSEQIKSIKIELGNIEKKQLTASLKANGILKVPNQNRATATASLGGVIKSILVQAGNVVREGQVIATISNNSFIIMQEEFINVSAKSFLAEQELARQKELQVGNAGALKNLQSAESELKSLKARKSSLRKQLELIGFNTENITSDNIQSVASIKSPINGAISNVLVNIGSYVEANNPIAEIVDNDQLHLDLYVYEKDLAKLKVGQTIHFTLTNNPGKEYDADVFAISNTFEQSTKAIAVHATVKGNRQGLIDGMSITALVSLENATVDAIPTNAIVSSEGQDFIFIVAESEAEEEHSTAENNEEAHNHEHHEELPEGSLTFERIAIKKGTTDIGYSEISLLQDIPHNSKVVVNGAFFLLAKMTNQGEAHEH
ncbi:MAG: efflux RND transporter periplasmic adaptor subunit [Bacteroidota bacterium]